jgi:hypothetical protein
MPKKTILILTSFLLIHALITAQRNSWLGGSFGIDQPSNIGNKKNEIGFKDVASTGLKIDMNGHWFYNKRMSLGATFSFSHFPQNEKLWDVGQYGQVDNRYLLMNLMLQGRYYFSHHDFRPFLGIGFGANALLNRLRFESAYSGTTADASVSYHSKTIKPGFTPEVGFLVLLDKKLFLQVNAQFSIIPFLKPEPIAIKQDGYTVAYVVQNPHGHQNHISLSAGLLFKL